MTMDSDERILGVWTREEFIDTLVLAMITGITTAMVTILYNYISKWLEIRTWK